MSLTSLFRPVMTLGLTAALVVSSQPLSALAAAPAVVTVGAASFDEVGDRLYVPVQGQAPRVHVQQLSARQFVADLAGCELAEAELQSGRPSHSKLAGWSMSTEPSLRGVRIRMAVQDDVRPVARFDAAASRFVFSFVRNTGSEPRLADAPRFSPRVPAKPGAVEPRFPTRVDVGGVAVAARPAPGRRVDASAGGRVASAGAPVASQPAAKAVGAAMAAHAPGAAPRSAQPSEAAPHGAPPRLAAPQVARKLADVAVATTARPVTPVSRESVALRGAEVSVRHLPLVLLSAANPAPRATRSGKGLALHAAVKAHRPVAARSHRASPSVARVAASVATLGLPTYRPGAEVLVVPVVRGSLDRSRIEAVRLSKRWSYIDVAAARPSFSGVRYQERDNFEFQRWVMARRPGRDITRISFATGVASRLDVKVSGDELLVAVRPVGQVLAAAPGPRSVAGVARSGDARTAAAPLAQPQAASAAKSRPEAQPEKKLTLVAGLARRAAAPAGVVESRVRRPFYDAERFGLAIPYEGRTPLYRWAKRDANGAVIELKADVSNPAHLQAAMRRSGSWGSWKLARRSHRGPLALELAFAHPSEVSIAADPERKQLLVIPQPRIAQVSVAEVSAVRSAFAPLVVDQTGSNLFIPFRGEVPRYVIEQVSPTFAYVVFEAASLRDGGIQFFTPNAHPSLNYLLVTQPEGTSTVRLAVSMSQPGAAAVYQDPDNTRLVVTLAPDTPAAQATGPKALRVPEAWPGAVRPAPEVQSDRGQAPRS